MSRDPVNAKPRAGKAKSFNEVKWINWALSPEQKAQLKAWSPTLEDLDGEQIKIIQSSHRITTSYDSYGDCYTTSIVPTADNKINTGYILTGKGSTPIKSFKQALYIHFHVFEGDWSTYSTSKGIEEMDD